MPLHGKQRFYTLATCLNFGEYLISLQPDVLTGYGEDGAQIQRYDTGRPSVNITVPTRYLHSHTGIIERGDFDGAVQLLIAVLKRLDAETVKELSSF